MEKIIYLLIFITIAILVVVIGVRKNINDALRKIKIKSESYSDIRWIRGDIYKEWIDISPYDSMEKIIVGEINYGYGYSTYYVFGFKVYEQNPWPQTISISAKSPNGKVDSWVFKIDSQTKQVWLKK